MLAYRSAVHGLSNRLLLLFAIALDLPLHFFDPYFDKPMMMLRPLHYSAQVSLPDEVDVTSTIAIADAAAAAAAAAAAVVPLNHSRTVR